MMAVRPDLVDLSKAEAQVPQAVIEMDKASIIWDIAEITKTGATGDPTKASREKGGQMLEILTDLIADAITGMRAQGWDYRTK